MSKLVIFSVFVFTILLTSCGGSSSNSGGGGGGSVEAAANFAYLGTWTGRWTNTTFGSSGSVLVEIIDNGDGTLTVTVDLGGFVGGLIDPDPESDIVSVNADGSVNYNGSHDMLGELNVSVSGDGQLEIDTPNIVTSGFDDFSVTGTVTETMANLSTSVNFTGGGSATGTVTATKN